LDGAEHWRFLLNSLKERNLVGEKMPVSFAAATATTATSGNNNAAPKIVEVSSDVREWPEPPV
jgi:hypothetical protein